MDMTGETAVMSVLKMWLHNVHKRKKRVQNLDINILSQIDGHSIIYIGHSMGIHRAPWKDLMCHQVLNPMGKH